MASFLDVGKSRKEKREGKGGGWETFLADVWNRRGDGGVERLFGGEEPVKRKPRSSGQEFAREAPRAHSANTPHPVQEKGKRKDARKKGKHC